MHIYNPSYSGGRDREYCHLRLRQKVSDTTISINKLGMWVHSYARGLGRRIMVKGWSLAKSEILYEK
jgi:hypothetical protein